MARCVLLSARRFSFEGEKDKRQVEGVTITYLEPGMAETGPERRGTAPLSVSAGPELWHKVAELPGVYECDFRKRPGKGGKAVEQLHDVTFIEAVNIDKIATAKKVGSG